MKKATIILFLFCLSILMYTQTKSIDIIQFGNNKSEGQHHFESHLTQTFKGGLNEPARRILPKENISWEGGKMIFKMKVDPNKQNYITVRCWGSEGDNSVVFLFIEGKQIGYRHLGDIDLLHRGNGNIPFNNRFYYYTLPLPIKYTQGKKEVNLEMRAYGAIWDYGGTFETFQKDLKEPTIGFYKAYTHTETCFVPEKNEKQGKDEVSVAQVRSLPDITIFDELKKRVCDEINTILNKETRLGQQEIWLLADAYNVAWTPAYKNPIVLEKVTKGIDDHYKAYSDKPEIIYSDLSVYNGDWMTTALLARSIRKLWNELKGDLDTSLLQTTRRDAWSEMMAASLDYGTTHRRHYTNQSMIIDMAVYECNRALMLMKPSKALPEYQALKYLHESMAMTPWLGKETEQGPEKPLGDNYWQLTSKGLTKELGFTGYYGEVMDWVVSIYETTCISGIPSSGDAKIKEQIIKIMDARNYFRYPAVDNEGYKCFRAEAVVGWRDGGHYPGDILYGDRAIAWDASPLMTAAATLHPRALGAAQLMIRENQLFHLVEQKMKLPGIRVVQSLLHVPDQYNLVVKQKPVDYSLPMSSNMPDFVFSDEEDGVIAIKNGEEILYASLYWRARTAINNLAKIHYITPTTDRIANIYIDSEYTPGGMTYKRSNRTNIEHLPIREFYPEISSAHTGDELPIARIPEGVKYKQGSENIYAGKADFYVMRYGKYLIGMNCTKDKTFDLKIPVAGKVVLLPSNEKIEGSTLKVQPMTTYVLLL